MVRLFCQTISIFLLLTLIVWLFNGFFHTKSVFSFNIKVFLLFLERRLCSLYLIFFSSRVWLRILLVVLHCFTVHSFNFSEVFFLYYNQFYLFPCVKLLYINICWHYETVAHSCVVWIKFWWNILMHLFHREVFVVGHQRYSVVLWFCRCGIWQSKQWRCQFPLQLPLQQLGDSVTEFVQITEHGHWPCLLWKEVRLFSREFVLT